LSTPSASCNSAVFVANMTGNIVFIGFGMARAPGFSLAGSVVALLAFLAGAAVGGPIVQRLGPPRDPRTHHGRGRVRTARDRNGGQRAW
jgi:Protein of unknown function (DUF1275)